jgi:hypothetical protein
MSGSGLHRLFALFQGFFFVGVFWKRGGVSLLGRLSQQSLVSYSCSQQLSHLIINFVVFEAISYSNTRASRPPPVDPFLTATFEVYKRSEADNGGRSPRKPSRGQHIFDRMRNSHVGVQTSSLCESEEMTLWARQGTPDDDMIKARWNKDNVTIHLSFFVAIARWLMSQREIA